MYAETDRAGSKTDDQPSTLATALQTKVDLNRKIAIVFFVACFLAAALWESNTLRITAHNIVIAEAKRTSVAWAKYIGAELPGIEEYELGKRPGQEEIEFLLSVREIANIYRFKLFDRNGNLQLISDDLGTDRANKSERKAEHSDMASRVAETGRVSSSLHDGSGSPDRPEFYAETYVPIYRDGALAAVVEVYSDQTELHRKVMDDFVVFGAKIAAGVLLAIALPVYYLIYMLRLIRRQKNKLERAERARSDFFAHMNHELRTPLNSIIGYTEMMTTEQFGTIGNRKYKEYLTNIHNSGTHLLTLVNDVLDMSKIEAGQLTIQEENFTVTEVFDGSIGLLSKQLDEKEIQVDRVPVNDDTALRADPQLFRQVIVNLLSNAIKFSKPRSTIRFATEVDNAGWLKVAIADTGRGIAKSDLKRVLEPFGQARDGIDKSHHGTGLGLPLCLSLMQLHGGNLAIESTLGEGTTVTVTFPPNRVVQPN